MKRLRKFANKAKCWKEDIIRMDAISKPQVAQVLLTSHNEASYHNVLACDYWIVFLSLSMLVETYQISFMYMYISSYY